MGDGFHVVPDELRGYAEYMRGMMGDLNAINRYVCEQGANTTGFTGLLTVLHPVVVGVGNLFGEMLTIAQDRLGGSAQGLDDTAATYEAVDSTGAASADRLADQLQGAA